MLRLYFNRRVDRPWSIDSGPGTEERTFEDVYCNGFAKTRFDPDKLGSQDFPCAWLEFTHALIDITSGGKVATITLPTRDTLPARS
ncbi:MAG: hypothetical protein WAN65_19160 [Candidatus Sulfotelmatobacter sp.]